MQSKDFLKSLTQFLVQFLNRELEREGFGSRFRVEAGLEEVSSDVDKRGFWNRLGGQSLTRAFLQSYSVQRIQNSRNSVLKTEEVEKDGERFFVNRRSPETLEIKYLLVGPSLASNEGQELYAALFTIFFDHLQVEWSRGDQTETLKLNDLNEEDEPRAQALLTEQGISTLPLYSFSVRVPIASGRVISQDHRVLHRDLQFKRKTTSGGKQS
ncbi:MAG: hypothetical protein EA369_07355 [Bradymonadales bacterium]|nr:MAG: hypothetical protein EA369_07355 [Bradymonadales bacterium]